MRREFGPELGFDASPHLDHQDPDPQVAVRHNHDWKNEMEEDDGDGVRWAGRLRKRTRVDPGVVLQGADVKVWHYSDHGQYPDEKDVEKRVLVAVQLVILEAVTDIAVAIDGNASDVKYRSNHAQSHQESTDLAVDESQIPSFMDYGDQHERIRIDGYHQVSYCQAHHK